MSKIRCCHYKLVNNISIRLHIFLITTRFALIDIARNIGEFNYNCDRARLCVVLSGLAKVWNLGGREFVVGGSRGGPLAECFSRSEFGRDLEESRETGNGEGALSQPYVQRL